MTDGGLTDDEVVRVSEFWVSLLPETHANWDAFLITVQYRGRGRWAVCRGPYVLNRKGGWVHRGSTRFNSAAEALLRARGAYPKVRVNGWRYDGVRFDRDGNLASPQA